MENASNALIMAGGILLGIMILSFGIILFSIFGSFTKEQQEEISSVNLYQFNSQFTKYEGDGNTAHDIVTIINLVKTINDPNNTNMSQREFAPVSVIVNHIQPNSLGFSTMRENDTQHVSEENLRNFLKYSYDAEGKPIRTYSCSVNYNNQGKVNQILFQ